MRRYGIYLTNNTPEVREELEKQGFTMCACASFPREDMLHWFPLNHNIIHGSGDISDYVSGTEDWSKEQRLEAILAEAKRYKYITIVCDTVQQFIMAYNEVKDAGEYLPDDWEPAMTIRVER